MAVFINQPGDNVFTGMDGVYDQVDYTGSLTDYVFSRNEDGTVAVTHPTLGTDTLSSIEGFWFSGEQAWYSLEQALDLTGGTTEPSVISGTDGDDALVGSAINNTFIGSFGDDSIDGNGGAYNQVDYGGSLRDYVFTQNADGSVSVSAAGGTDTLTDIDGFWFSGEQAWYSVEQALELAGGPGGNTITGTDGDDILIGTDGDDIIEALAGRDVIFASEGADFVDGGAGGEFITVDTLTYAAASAGVVLNGDAQGFAGAAGDSYQNIEVLTGSRFDDTIETSAGVQSVNGGYGNDTLIATNGGNLNGGMGDDTLVAVAGQEQSFFGGEGSDSFVLTPGMGLVEIVDFDPRQDVFDISAFGITDFNSLQVSSDGSGRGQVVDFGNGDSILFFRAEFNLSPAMFGLSGQANVSGTSGDDFLSGGEFNNIFIGSTGNDNIVANGGEYNQVDYDGFLDDFTFFRNDDGTITVTNEAFGTDTLSGIDGVWFGAEQAWYSIDSLVSNPGPRDFIFGTGDQAEVFGDRLYGDGGNNTFVNVTSGVVDGNGGAYNQIDLAGFASDYQFVINDFTANDGNTVQVRGDANILLRDIDGVWFSGQQEWFSLESLIEDPLAFTNGDDNIRGTIEDESIFGGDGNDIINGIRGTDIIDGGAGNDQIFGDGVLIGGAGDDILRGTGELNGGDGNDTFIVSNSEPSVIDGGAGIDTVELNRNRDDFVIELNDDGSYSIYNLFGAVVTAQDVEFFEFNDQTVSVDDLFGMA